MNGTKVRIKDVPWSDVADHFLTPPAGAQELWETQLRGRWVTLTGEHWSYPIQNVEGWETTLEFQGSYYVVCSICAEIGD